jgi:hypothetical protein
MSGNSTAKQTSDLVTAGFRITRNADVMTELGWAAFAFETCDDTAHGNETLYFCYVCYLP